MSLFSSLVRSSSINGVCKGSNSHLYDEDIMWFFFHSYLVLMNICYVPLICNCYLSAWMNEYYCIGKAWHRIKLTVSCPTWNQSSCDLFFMTMDATFNKQNQITTQSKCAHSDIKAKVNKVDSTKPILCLGILPLSMRPCTHNYLVFYSAFRPLFSWPVFRNHLGSICHTNIFLVDTKYTYYCRNLC